MNGTIQNQLDRVEVALNTLIESITSYNPSLPAAHALLAADDTLIKDLKIRKSYTIDLCLNLAMAYWLPTVSVHQRNHALLHSLRTVTAALDHRTTKTLDLLSLTRVEILATPTALPSITNRVPYLELLYYAQNICKYSSPSALQRPPPVLKQAPQEALPTPKAFQPVNGVFDSFTSVSTQALNLSQTYADDTGATSSMQARSRDLGISFLSDAEHKWLHPQTQVSLVPWPSEEVVRRGALSQIQAVLESGDHPENMAIKTDDVVVEGGALVGLKREGQENGEANQKECEEIGLPRQADRPGEEKPAVFGSLDLYDPDAE